MSALVFDTTESVIRDMLVGVSHTEMSIINAIAAYYIPELMKLNVDVITSDAGGCKRNILRVTGPESKKAIPILEHMVDDFKKMDEYNIKTENEVRILFGLEPRFRLKDSIQYLKKRGTILWRKVKYVLIPIRYGFH